jgi:hypothetical protein
MWLKLKAFLKDLFYRPHGFYDFSRIYKPKPSEVKNDLN